MVQPAALPPLVRGVWYPMTWEEFLEWAPDEGQAEWVDGKGIAHVSNSAPHVRIAVFLTQLLGLYLRIFKRGEVFVDQMLLRLPERPAGRMPDLFVIGWDDRERVRHQWVDGPALLAVEVLSEESLDRDTREKRAEYEQAGVREYLILDSRPGRDELSYLRLDANGRYQPVEPDEQGRFHSEALPGFWFDPVWFRQDPPPDIERLMLRIAPAEYREYLERLLAEASE